MDNEQLHRERWIRCRKCDLVEYRSSVVVGEGALPCDLLVLGTAPGKVEDVRGKPFCGPPGRLRRQLWDAAERIGGVPRPSLYLANLVACRPCDSVFGENRNPTSEEVWACWPRLQELAVLAKAQKVILFGELPARFGRKLWPDGIRIMHPAGIIRAGGTESPAFRTAVRAVATIFASLAHKGGPRHGQAQEHGNTEYGGRSRAQEDRDALDALR